MKRFVAIILLIPLLLCSTSCTRLSRTELDSFLSSDGKEILEDLYTFDSYSMTYTTVMYNSSEEKYVTFEIKTVFERKTSLTFSEIKLDGSGIITGFALTLWQMRAYEKGVGIFYSDLGYKHSGSGKQIPGYAPLIFEIQIVDKPKEE